mmetsp:Transcript_61849/g.135450  ORF Transcript_61849/g.135450 Transcript_61849/m.135450 type:complete len:142 (-) Transcript_61849:976-1401(-)
MSAAVFHKSRRQFEKVLQNVVHTFTTAATTVESKAATAKKKQKKGIAKEKPPSFRNAPSATVKIAWPRPNRLSRSPKDLPQERLFAGTRTRGSTGMIVEAIAMDRSPPSKTNGTFGSRARKDAPKRGKNDITTSVERRPSE